MTVFINGKDKDTQYVKTTAVASPVTDSVADQVFVEAGKPLRQYIVDASGAGTPTPLAADKSIADAVGHTGGALVADSGIGQYIAAGTGTKMPANTSVYDTTKNISILGVTGTPVEKSLTDILHKDGFFTYDNTEDSLEAISDKIGNGTRLLTETAGGSTTLITSANITEGVDFWKGALVVALSGVNTGQARYVVDSTAGTITVARAFSANVAIADTLLLISADKTNVWEPQPSVVLNAVAVTDDSEASLIDLSTAGYSYALNSLRLKAPDPGGADTITIRLYELINAVSTQVDSFNITTANAATYFSLWDMFGEHQITGDSIKVTARTTLVAHTTISGQYHYSKAMTG